MDTLSNWNPLYKSPHPVTLRTEARVCSNEGVYEMDVQQKQRVCEMDAKGFDLLNKVYWRVRQPEGKEGGKYNRVGQ